MTALAQRPNCSLLIVDAQNGVVASTYERDRVVAKVVANVGELVRTARRERTPVWVQYHDEELERATMSGASCQS